MKEARPARTRSLLLRVLILGGLAFQSQAYYHPDEGRWLSRDPIGERGGRNLYRCVRNNPIGFVDPLGLWETGKDWPTQCGSCSVKYEKKSLPGEGGELAPGGYSWGTPSATTCGGGTGPNDPSRFSISYPNTECTATVRFDPNTDPESIIPGVDISFRSHEQKHVQCMADAYGWALEKLGVLAKRCCCKTTPMVELAKLIQTSAYLKRISCSARVDCEDYRKATDPGLKKQAGNECDLSAHTAAVLMNKEQQIDQALKDLEKCE